MARAVTIIVALLAAVGPISAVRGATAAGDRPAPPPPLARAADEALAAVERARGVRLSRPVVREVVAPAAVRAYLAERIRSEYPPSFLALEQARYRRMGLLASDRSLEELLLAALTHNIAGYYDPARRALRVSEVAVSSALRSVLLHEWTHALQHERADLERLSRRVVGGGDYAAARLALFEGEAVAVSVVVEGGPEPGGAEPAGWSRLARRLEHVARAAEGPAFAAALPGMPKVLVEELRFAYGAGLVAVLAAYERGGWGAVERWQTERPPLSSEQVLHPERALGPAPDCPQALALPPLTGVLPPGRALSESETLGEAGWRAFLRVHHDRARADAAAAGWDGDRYAAVVRADGARAGGASGDHVPANGSRAGGPPAEEPAILIVSEWDREQDAAELVAAVRDLGERVPALAGARWQRRGTRVAAWLGDGPPPTGLFAALFDETRAREVCDHLEFEAARRPAGPSPSAPP